MAGVKGKSGRKSNANEEFRLRVIEKCWKQLDADLDDPNVPDAVKRDIRLKVCVKSMPTELAGGFTAELTAMGTIEKVVNGVKETMSFNIGTPIGDEADPA